MANKNGKGNLRTYLRWPIIFVVYFGIVNVIIYLMNKSIGAVFFIFWVVCVIIAMYLITIRYNSLFPAIYRAIVDIAKREGIDMSKIDIPYFVVSMEGKVIWLNDAMLNIDSGMFVGQDVENVFEEVDKKLIDNLGEDKVSLLSSIGDKRFKLTLRKILIDNVRDNDVLSLFDGETYMVMIHLTDVTENYLLKQAFDDNKQVIGLINIDNFEEVAENMEDSKASMLIAMVDRKLTRYISYNGGVVKKLEKDKYFFVTDKKDIEDMIKDRFSILEQTKDIIGGDNIPLTLSIGVGYEGKSIEANYELARVAMDMALGRGGDQVVVKEGQATKYYGGKSASKVTNARVRARVKATSFKEMLDTKDKVLVMGHRYGDLDSFGASIGVWSMAKFMGKDVHIVINSLTNATFDMKKKFDMSETYPKDMFIDGNAALTLADDNTLLVLVDHNFDKISDESALVDKELDMVIFDHHRVSENSITDALLSYIDPAASSTCELISDIMLYFDDRMKLKQLEADAMLGGIMLDTMYFTCQTTAKTFDAASFLKKKGADTDRVRKLLRRDKESEMIKNDTINNNMEVYKNAYAIAVLHDKEGVESGVVKAEIANELIDIKGIKASIVVTKEGEKYSISSRAIDEMNVQVLMEKLGGGGHRSQAGALIEAESFEDAIEKIKKAIDEVVSEEGK